MNIRFVLGIILSVMVLSLGFSVFTTAATTLQVVSPQNGQTFHYGQQLIVIAKYVPNTVATVYLVHGTTSIPEGTYTFNSTGYITVNLGTFGSGNLAEPGEYTVDIDVSSPSFAAASVTVYYKPFVATIVAQVQNEQHLPVSGAMVYLYNTTAGIHSLVATAMTNSTGLAVFHVTAFNFTLNFQVVASEAGYINASASVSVLQNQTETVVLTLYPAVLNVYVLGAEQNGEMVDPLNPAGYSELVASEGENVTVYIATVFAGQPITNATVEVMVTTPTGTTVYNATPVTTSSNSGYYKVSLMLPLTNVSYDALMYIIATYSSLVATNYVPVLAQVNYTALIDHYVNTISSEVEVLNATVYALTKEISALNSSIMTLKSELSAIANESTSLQSTVKSLESSISLLNGTVSSLSSTVSSLSNQVSTLNNKVSNLNSEVGSISSLVYGGLIAGIIGLIIAIVALVLVYRKIS